MSTVLYKTFSYAVSREIKFTIHAEYNGKQYKMFNDCNAQSA